MMSRYWLRDAAVGVWGRENRNRHAGSRKQSVGPEGPQFQRHVSIAEGVVLRRHLRRRWPREGNDGAARVFVFGFPVEALEGRLGAPGRVIRKCGDFRPDPSTNPLDCMILRFSGDCWAADVCPNSAVRHMRRERGVGVGVLGSRRDGTSGRERPGSGGTLDPMHRWMDTTSPSDLACAACILELSVSLSYIGCDHADARNV